MSAQKIKAIPVSKLRWQCDPEKLGFKTTKEITSGDEIIGQERAMKAIKLGLEMDSPGYNIFVAGLTGTGKTTTVKSILEKMDRAYSIPDDICYVYNFDNPDAPKVLMLSPGMGCDLKNEMDNLVDDLLTKLPKILESDVFKKRQKKLLEEYNQKSIDLIAAFEEQARLQGLGVVQMQIGQVTKPDLMPVIDKEIVPWQQLEKMVEEGKFSKDELKNLKKKHNQLSKELDKALRENRKIEKEAQAAIREMHDTFFQPVISGMIFELKEKFGKKEINTWLDQVEKHMIENIDLFTGQKTPAQDNPLAALMPMQTNDLIEYRVNVFVDNSNLNRRPVVIETAPNYKNLFGTIERVVDRNGTTYTDFTKIKAGSLIRANGGFLVLNINDLFYEAGVWQALKRTLKYNSLDIQTYDPYYLLSQTALKPEAININVKIVVIGDSYFYRQLYAYDEDFRKVFKIRADFDSVMNKNQAAVNNYARFVKSICDKENLHHFDKTGVAEIIEYGVRLSGRQYKVSTRFSDIADLIREAHYWAKNDKSKLVKGKHVNKAIVEKRQRSCLTEDKIQEMIDRGNILIDIRGSKKGQLNGLAVYDMGDYSFGRPSRITATVGVGRAGIINIEREAKLSGKTHDKGILIIGGYFRDKYSQDKPLSFTASLAFEQSYSGVDGDSASSTEIYALLSELSGLPIRQDFAVTGSVNQKGEIQPIGGVNQKVEGFFDVCSAKGLTGKQGVLIPVQNVDDLMLRPEVVEAVSKGLFNIYAIKTIDEGIELLTGVPAGKKRKKGGYPKESVHFKVEHRLLELADLLNNNKSDEAK